MTDQNILKLLGYNQERFAVTPRQQQFLCEKDHLFSNTPAVYLTEQPQLKRLFLCCYLEICFFYDLTKPSNHKTQKLNWNLKQVFKLK